MKQKGKILRAIIALGLFVQVSSPALSLASLQEMHIESRTDLIYYDVSGPGSSSSIYQTGANYLQEIDFMAKHLFAQKWDSTFNINLRVTDYDNFDTETTSIERLSYKLKNDGLSLHAGDYFANFSQYSMNKSIKGVAVQKEFGDRDNYLRLAYGSFDAQWEYIYDKPDNEPLDRFGGGVRYQRAGDNYRLGFNLAHVDDRKSDENRGTQDAFQQIVSAFDWEYRIPGIAVYGESAYSDTNRYVVNSAKSSFAGTAHRASLKANLNDLRIHGKLERVGVDFLTLGGGASPDRYRAYFKTDYKISKLWKIYGVYDFYRNNLSDRLSFTTRNTSAEIGLDRRRMFNRSSMRGTVSLRRKWIEASNYSTDSVTDRIKVSVTDRIARVIRVKGFVESILKENKTTNQSPEDYLYQLDFSSRHRFSGGDWELLPRLSLSHQDRENLTAGGDDTTDSARLNLRARYKSNANMGIDLERYDTDLEGASSVDSIRERAAVYYEYRPEKLKDASIRFEAGHNEYEFSNDSQDYREQIYKVLFRVQFNKKGEVNE